MLVAITNSLSMDWNEQGLVRVLGSSSIGSSCLDSIFYVLRQQGRQRGCSQGQVGTLTGRVFLGRLWDSRWWCGSLFQALGSFQIILNFLGCCNGRNEPINNQFLYFSWQYFQCVRKLIHKFWTRTIGLGRCLRSRRVIKIKVFRLEGSKELIDKGVIRYF